MLRVACGRHLVGRALAAQPGVRRTGDEMSHVNRAVLPILALLSACAADDVPHLGAATTVTSQVLLACPADVPRGGSGPSPWVLGLPPCTRAIPLRTSIGTAGPGVIVIERISTVLWDSRHQHATEPLVLGGAALRAAADGILFAERGRPVVVNQTFVLEVGWPGWTIPGAWTARVSVEGVDDHQRRQTVEAPVYVGAM